MSFSPIEASEEITGKYKRYLKTIFQINNPVYESQFVKELEKEDLLAKGPFLDAVDSFRKGKSLRELIEEGLLPKTMEKCNFPLDRALYKHQENAIRQVKEGHNLVVSTGTG